MTRDQAAGLREGLVFATIACLRPGMYNRIIAPSPCRTASAASLGEAPASAFLIKDILTASIWIAILGSSMPTKLKMNPRSVAQYIADTYSLFGFASAWADLFTYISDAQRFPEDWLAW